MILSLEQLEKFNISGPRYTSYPTAPNWVDTFTEQDYRHTLQSFDCHRDRLSIYVHIPFCPKMCYYCGCNVLIRKPSDEVGDRYIDYLDQEMTLVTREWSTPATVNQLHWGGGTPTYLSAPQLARLFSLIQSRFQMASGAECAIEVDPRTLTFEQVKTLSQIGFNRISMGIQDTNEQVQRAINRLQPTEMVQTCVEWIRTHHLSLNFDLIYGLPHQTPATMADTIQDIIKMSPDRIALYSYAHVPWLKSHQSLLNPNHIPMGRDKLALFITAREQLLAHGYQAIGMDHFAKASDGLALAYRDGVLHRNFMGYTLKPADDSVGFGLTAIGQFRNAFTQNVKTMGQYMALLDEGHLPIERGLNLTPDDLRRQWAIQSIMCQFKLDFMAYHHQFGSTIDALPGVMSHLRTCEKDGLITLHEDGLTVTELGQLFVRIVAMGFDAYLGHQTGFSKTI